MGKKAKRFSLKMLCAMAILSVMVSTGCPKTTSTGQSAGEKQVAPQAAPAPQEAKQEAPPATSSPGVPAAPSPVSQATPPASAAVPSAPEAAQDPIAAGSVLLNPAQSQDAQKIQTRLAEFGLYEGTIDGIWGKGSRASLKAFKEQNGLKSSDQWDRETQILLFKKTSQPGEPSPQAGEPPISSGSVLLKPSVKQDAQNIQKRLQELGIYKGAIDGVWGKGSRTALKAFKEQNGLESSDQWDRETQILLFRGTGK